MKSDLIIQYQNKTNRKLLYAHLTLELLEQQEEPYSAALRESCLLHLINAYNALVDEIQARLNISPQADPDPIAIVRNMKHAGISSMAEMNILARLEEDPHSWLSSLWRIRTELLGRPNPKKSAAIQLLNDSSKPLESAALHNFLAELEKLSKQIRALMTES